MTLQAALPLAAAAALLVTSAPAPDAHDRALAARLDAGVATFRTLAAPSSRAGSLPKHCAVLNKGSTANRFAAAFALTPVLLGEVVHEYKPQLVSLRKTIDGIHPDSPLFAHWIAAERQSFALLLRLDTHGKKIDLCQAATVMLDKSSTAADWQRAIGFGPALVSLLFNSKAEATLTSLDPKMRAFFVAAGLSRKSAKTLTS
jgi:hypothetical protein